ncbi:MAG: BMP family lipoprotein [Christensenellales bacterium]
MKKILSVLLALAALLALATSAALAAEIALVTDVGTIDDESFNQACWEGVKAYAEANGKTYQYYQPGADSTDERLNSIDQAVSEGAKVIVCPGYLFGETVATAQELYPDVDIIAVDVSLNVGRRGRAAEPVLRRVRRGAGGYLKLCGREGWLHKWASWAAWRFLGSAMATSCRRERGGC